MSRINKIIFPLILIVFPLLMKGSNFNTISNVEDGYELWLRYPKVSNEELLENYRNTLKVINLNDNSPTMHSVKHEIEKGLSGLLAQEITFCDTLQEGSLILGTVENSAYIASLKLSELKDISTDGYLIKSQIIKGKQVTVIAGNTDLGVLYGTFAYLRLLQTQQPVENLKITNSPKMQLRTVNHWDNADRTVERGYAGASLWDWSTLPYFKDPRYTDFARASASIGINGITINNVNASAKFITPEFLEKIKVLGDIFRPYGLKIYIAVNYSSPITLGDIKTADPLDNEVKNWWKNKTEEIYTFIPDFGGFLVKADSEGQPGPKTYGRNHAEGANMLANALKPYGGIVIWRAFVYDLKQEDRVREAYDEFVPLDGKFKDNVVLQIKKGPVDFMPREPFSPLFGAMPNTNLMLEFQVTQEYLGNGNHLVYKGPMYKEILDSETYAKSGSAKVGELVAGEVYDYNLSGMAAVTNPGIERNWTAHPFVQSSWYTYGRLAWDYNLRAEQTAEEWIRMTFSNDQEVVSSLMKIMLQSGEAAINFREPLGLTHQGTGSHYGPAPWSSRSKKYSKVDEKGIGFNRTSSGSKAVNQFHEPLASQFENIKTTPEKYLLWFHHVSWDYEMKSGKTLWYELVSKYYQGVETVEEMQKTFASLEGKIDTERFDHIKALLEIQLYDAIRWRDSCVLYFQQYSEMQIPAEFEKPDHNLEYYKKLENKIYVK